MQQKVAKVTKVLFEEGNGNANLTGRILANFTRQRVVQPFVRNTEATPQELFGNNALSTVLQTKKVNRKAGCDADMLRRHVIASGASGPMSPHHVCIVLALVCTS